VSYLNGRAASLGACLTTGLRYCLPLIGLMLLMWLAVGFGFLLLIVPGAMMAVAWAVAIPALVVERTGVFGAFSRSADLTRGRRWAVFGLLLLYFILSEVVRQVLVNLYGAVFAAANQQAALLHQLPVNGVVQVSFSVIASAGMAAIYYELRAIREGVGPEALAAVFD
jgi:hypothetical protein